MDTEFLKKCVAFQVGSAYDKNLYGEYVQVDGGFYDLRITIGKDYYETKKHDDSEGCCRYDLIKNGEVILSMNPGFIAYDPNRSFMNFGGKLVWELSGDFMSVILVDGVNYNEKYGLEGSYFPYVIKGKLIYFAEKNGKFQVVYDGKFIGPEFYKVNLYYCCAMAPAFRSNGQYWFLGSRNGSEFIVSIQ